MTNFKVNEIAWYTGEDFTFAPCYCIIINTDKVGANEQKNEGYYLFMPLVADQIMRSYPEFDGWCALPKQLRKVTLSLQPEYQVEQPHTEPEEVAPEERSEAAQNLKQLRDGYDAIEKLVIPGMSSTHYLNCDGVNCDNCPMLIPSYDGDQCEVLQIKKVLKTTLGYKQKNT